MKRSMPRGPAGPCVMGAGRKATLSAAATRVEGAVAESDPGDDAFGGAVFEKSEPGGGHRAAMELQPAAVREARQNLVRQPADPDLQGRAVFDESCCLFGNRSGVSSRGGRELRQLGVGAMGRLEAGRSRRRDRRGRRGGAH